MQTNNLITTKFDLKQTATCATLPCLWSIFYKLCQCKFWRNHSRMNFLFSTYETLYLLETILDDCSLILRTQFLKESRIKINIKIIIAHLLLNGTEKCTLNHTSYVRSHITRNWFLLHGGLNWQPGQNKLAAYNLATFSGIFATQSKHRFWVLDTNFFGH